jgi:tetratricopeptide (TPR) repeat protein
MSDNNTTIKLFSGGVSAYIKEDFKTSIKLFSQALKQDRKFALVYSSRGAAYLKTNKINKAISDFTRAIRLKPDYARSFHLRGLAYVKAGDIARAYRDFHRAIEIDPDLSAVYRCLKYVQDKKVHDQREIENLEMVDYLASMRAALLIGEKKAA